MRQEKIHYILLRWQNSEVSHLRFVRMSHCDLNILSSRMLSPVYPSSRALAAPSRPARSARRTIKMPRRPRRRRQCCAGRGSVRSSSQQQSGERDRRDRRRRTDSPSFTCCRPPVSVALAGARGRLGRPLGRLSLGGAFRQNGLCCEGGNSAICTLLAEK